MTATKLIVLMGVLALVQCSGERSYLPIAYPHPQPDSIALPFLPGIVSSDSLDFNAAFSTDGKYFYFSRSHEGRWMIFMTILENEAWKSPVLAPFSEPEYSQADPFITEDGSVYYISNRPRDEYDSIADYDIWVVRPQNNGSWSKPENIREVNSDSTEYYVSVAANGNLYFASNRPGGFGSHDIYLSRYKNGSYTTPENLGPSINSPQMEHDPLISHDEQFLIFTSVDRADTFGNGDLYFSLKESRNQNWTQAKNMGKQFNTDTYEYCSYLTPDSKYFFYSTDYDVKWISSKYLPYKFD